MLCQRTKVISEAKSSFVLAKIFTHFLGRALENFSEGKENVL